MWFRFSHNAFLLFEILGPTCVRIITERALQRHALKQVCSVLAYRQGTKGKINQKQYTTQRTWS